MSISVIEPPSEFDRNSESSDYKVSTRKRRPVYTQSVSVKRYHKIPLKTQQQLFDLVFNQGKRIKQVAKDLKMNYSSAKSLIHYYRTQKRPAPEYVQKVLNGRRQAKYSQISKHKGTIHNLKIEVKVNKSLINSYNFYEALENQQFTAIS